MRIFMRALKPFGYHADHTAGEIIPVDLRQVEMLIKNGDAEIVVNNLGNNVDYDEHCVGGQVVPEWITAEDLEPTVLTPGPYKAPESTDTVICGNCGFNKTDTGQCIICDIEL